MKLSNHTTTAEFVEAASTIHNNKYDYSLVTYCGRNTKVCIICPTHGQFYQSPACHLHRKHGCPSCGLEQIKNLNPGIGTTSFIERARIVHGDKYNYNFVKYINNKKKVIIICSHHGEFLQSPINHIKGQGCPHCARKLRNKALSIGQLEFLRRAKLIHGDKYDYTSTKFTTKIATISIICKKHGLFQQTAGSHLNGRGCYQCGKEAIADGLRLNFDDVLNRSIKVHGDRYLYHQDSYIDTKKKMMITCYKHGPFYQTPSSHFLGGGCVRCGCSGFQKSVGDYLESLGVKVIWNDRNALSGLELDLYCPEKKLAIECNGVYWHSFDHIETKDEKYRHYNKHTLCTSLGITLISLTDEEWATNNILVRSMLAHKFGLSQARIYARKCELVTVCQKEYCNFVSINHIAGYRQASTIYGLRDDTGLVAVMSFARHKLYKHEIIRYCCKIGTSVVGAASKLLDAFKRDQKLTYGTNVSSPQLLSYADRRFSDGGLYRLLGMKQCGVTQPNYRYVKGCKTFSRQQFQKHKLSTKLTHFDITRSEASNMFANGYRRLWDAGHYRFVLES